MEPERIHPGFVSVNRDSGKDTLISHICEFRPFTVIPRLLSAFSTQLRKRSCLERPLAILWTRDWDVRDGYCDDKISEMSLKVYAAVVFVQCSKAV